MARSVDRKHARAVVATFLLASLLTPLAAMPALGAASTVPQTAAEADVVDTVAPTAPTNFRLVSRTRSGAITLGWDASYDAVGVAGYRIYKNGSYTGTL